MYIYDKKSSLGDKIYKYLSSNNYTTKFFLIFGGLYKQENSQLEVANKLEIVILVRHHKI